MITDTRGRELLTAALAFAEKSAAGEKTDIAGIPAVWDQRKWATLDLPESARQLEETDAAPKVEECGTAYCMAGFIAAQHPGYKVTIQREGYGWVYLDATIDGEFISYLETAPRMLFPSDEGTDTDYVLLDALWAGSNTIERVRYLVHLLLHGKPDPKLREDLSHGDVSYLRSYYGKTVQL